jgi:hypothetical protein
LPARGIAPATPIGRRAEELPRLRARLRETLAREPSHKELAEKLGIKESDIPMVEAAERNPYWSRATPGRFGAHQFQEHMKDTLVYCCWFAGRLRIVDVADPLAPHEVGYFIPEPAAAMRVPTPP